MATPEEEKNYLNDYEEKMKQAQQGLASGISDASTAATQQMQAANAAADQDVADVLIRLGEDARKAKQEQQVLSDMEASRAKWAGVTEAAAALSNLVGVGSFNSANQQHHQYSADWMKDADTKRQQRDARLDNIKANLDAMRMKSSQLKAANATTLAKMQQEAAEKAAKLKYDTETAVAAAQLKKAMADEEAARDMEALEKKQQHETEMLEEKQQFTASESAKDRASKERIYGVYGENGKGSGRGSSIALTIPEDADGGPEETLYIKPGSISATLSASVKSISDLDENDKAELELALLEGGSEAAMRSRILPFVTKSKQLRALLRKSASGSSQASPAAPATQDKKEEKQPKQQNFKAAKLYDNTPFAGVHKDKNGNQVDQDDYLVF